ncbi:hypothetical protein OEZ86_001165 [Tetradesmus obliquus]|nr:hypothetical protein OEZ86_001165 [Tetradesmus obliquus]
MMSDYRGILGGTFVDEVNAAFPAVAWQPSNLLRVLCFTLPTAAAAMLVNARLAAVLSSSSSSSSSSLLSPTAAETAAAAAAGLDVAESAAAAPALLHVSQEAVLAVLMPAAVWLALGPRVVSARWDSYWVLQTLATCAVLFPLVDPLLWGAWQPAVQAVLGPAPVNPLVATLQQAADAGDWRSVGLHCAASGVLGPLWEEVFWRSFFLTALTKVLPLPACIAFSSLNFAVLHLSPHNLLPLLVVPAGLASAIKRPRSTASQFCVVSRRRYAGQQPYSGR